MRRQSGLIVAGLLLLGACSNHPAATPKSTPPTASATTSPSHSATAPAWKLYRSSWEKGSFNYPSTWKVKIDTGLDAGQESVHLTAPSGFTLNWSAPLYGLGGGCDAKTEPHIFIDEILKMPDTHSRYQLWIVLLSIKHHKSLAVIDAHASPPLRLGDIGDCLYYPLFSSNHPHFTGISQFFTGFIQIRDREWAPSDKSQNMTDAQYIAQPDVQTVLKIFRSLRFS